MKLEARADQMILFARVVEAGSFAAAARALGLTRAAVSRQIGSLESALGAQLLNRSTRRMNLTEVGREFYQHCARIVAEAEEAERLVASLQGAVRGRLRIAAPVTFARRYIAPLVAPFIDLHREVSIELVLGDSTPDLIEEGFDLGIRIGALADSSLVVRKLAPSQHVVCASAAYLAERGRPERPADLRDHNCLLYSELSTPDVWHFRRHGPVRVRGNFSVNHGESLRQAVLDGLGIAYMPTFLVGEDIAAGALVPLLSGFSTSNRSVYAVYPPNRNLAPKVRAFVDFLAERFSPGPRWDEF